MATSTVVCAVTEYLRRVIGPDRDYVDGEIRERNLGERDHADLQMRFAYCFACRKRRPTSPHVPSCGTGEPEPIRVPELCLA